MDVRTDFANFVAMGINMKKLKMNLMTLQKRAKKGLDEMIEERLDSLIDKYTEKIENDTELIRMYRDELKHVFEETDGLSIPENARIARLQGVIERTALQVYLEKAFLNDLKQLKGEQVKD